MNKKGFTLIELLAVIVILGIIMVIAVPQILNVIEDSRRSSWEDSMKLVSEAVELKMTTSSMIGAAWTPTTCESKTECMSDTNGPGLEILQVADVTSDNYTVTSISKTGSKYEITIQPTEGGVFNSLVGDSDITTVITIN